MANCVTTATHSREQPWPSADHERRWQAQQPRNSQHPNCFGTKKSRPQSLIAMPPPSQLALADGTDSVAEAGGGAARHTRAWSVGRLAIVADRRRSRYRRPESTVQRAVRCEVTSLPCVIL